MTRRFKRRTTRRALRPRRVIFVEGETERQYFNALKQKASQVAVTVKLKKNPADMAKEARKILRGDWNIKQDEMWFLLDCEEPNNRSIPGYYQKLTDLINERQKTIIHLCLSNVCFEVWLLSHFQTTGLQGNARELQSSLTKTIGYKYAKGGKCKVDTFTSKTSDAMKNSRHTECSLDQIPSIGKTHIPHLIRSLNIITSQVSRCSGTPSGHT